MPATYEPIATTTLGSAAATITFSSIPATYTDLRLTMVTIPTAGLRPQITFNNDSGSNYSRVLIRGNGSTAASQIASSQTFIYTIGQTMAAINFIDFNVFSYAGNTYKTSLSMTSDDENGGDNVVAAGVQLWRSTSAITTIKLTASTSTFAAGTTATLYGIKNA